MNRVPWLNLSCYEGIANHVSEFIIRATSCTLRGNRESRIEVESFVHQDARYEGIGELHTEVESFVQQVARYEGIGESRTEVDSFVQQVARYGASYNALPLHYE